MFEFFKNIFKYISVSVFAKFFQALTILGVASLLVKHDFAIFGIIYSSLQLILVFIYAGLQEIIIGKYLFYYGLNRDKTFLNNISSLLLIQFVTISTLLTLYWIIHLSDFNLLILFFILSGGLFNSVLKLNAIFFQLHDQHTISIKLINSTIILPNICAALFLLIDREIDAFFLGYFLGALINYLFFSEYLKYIVFKDIFSFKGYPFKILSMSYPFLIISVISYMYGIGLTLILDVFLVNEQIANYFFICQIIGVFLIIQGSINQVWNPIFLNNYLINKLTLDVHQFIGSCISYIISLISGFLILFIEDLIQILPGNLTQYIGLNFYIYLFSVGYIILGHTNRTQILYYHNDDNKNIYLRNNLFVDLIGILLIVVLVYLYKEIGLYISFVIIFAIKSILNIYPLKNILSINYLEIIFSILFVSFSYMFYALMTPAIRYLFFSILVIFSTVFLFYFEQVNLKKLIKLINSSSEK